MLSGLDAQARWQYAAGDSQLTVKVYYDRSDRESTAEGASFVLNTYDLELQHAFTAGAAHRIVWGAGKRVNNYHIESIGSLQFLPAHRSLELGNVFAQDAISMGEAVELTAGLKLEHNAFSGWSVLPDLRVSWALTDTSLLWAAASRAIRAPTPFDVDVAEFVGPQLFLTGNPGFRDEELLAYQLGYRSQPHETFSFSASVFYNDYENLRTVEPDPQSLLPLRWDNFLGGHTYGVEAWAYWQVTSWWRLSPGVRSLRKHLEFEPGSSALVDTGISGNDPEWQATLKSSMDFGQGVVLDAFLRHTDALPDPAHEVYEELSLRLAGRPSPPLEVSVSGFNLLDDRHSEYASPVGEEITRTFFADVRFSF